MISSANCDQVAELACDFVDRRVSHEEHAAVEAHLHACISCRAELTHIVAVRNFMKGSLKPGALAADFKPETVESLRLTTGAVLAVKPVEPDSEPFAVLSLAERLGAAPWWAVSVALHVLVIILLGLITMTIGILENRTSVVVLTNLEKMAAPLPVEEAKKSKTDLRDILEAKQELHATDPNSTVQSNIVVPPEILAQAELGDHFETINLDRPDTQSAFGDLKQLQAKVEGYVRQDSFKQFTLKAPATVAEKDYVARAVSPAESAALRGDFHLHRGRLRDAKPLLEEALRLDANLAMAHESMGYLHYQEHQREEAGKEFTRAVELDSKNFFAHYFHARMLVEGGMAGETISQAQTSLERAIALNPNFAPAYATLAMFYSLRPETREKAAQAALKAAQLKPGELDYALNLAHTLLRTDRVEEARTLGQRILEAARTPEIRAAAEDFLRQADRYSEFLAQKKKFEEEEAAARKRYEEEARSDKVQLKADQQAGPESRPGATLAPETSSRDAAGASATRAPTTSGRRYTASGKIVQVKCSAPEMVVTTVSATGFIVKLHAANYFKVEYLTTSWEPPKNFNPCVHLKGRSADFTYSLAVGKPYDAEVISIAVKP